MTPQPAIHLKTPAELEVMYRAGRVVAEVHDVLGEALEPGMTTVDLDTIAELEIRARGASPSFKGYGGFPAALCVSVNEEIVHGIPSPENALAAGDVVSLDLGACLDGYHADAAVTWVVGEGSPEIRALVDACRTALWAGLRAAVIGARVGDISAAVGAVAAASGYAVVEGYCGHGIGRELHEQPPVPNEGRHGKGPELLSGMVLAVEPMLTAGSSKAVEQDDGWTAVAPDGSLSAHWEHTVAVTPYGPWVLTARAGEPEHAVDPVATFFGTLDAGMGG